MWAFFKCAKHDTRKTAMAARDTEGFQVILSVVAR